MTSFWGSAYLSIYDFLRKKAEPQGKKGAKSPQVKMT